MSNLVDHARRELELVGEEPDTIDWYLTVISAFSAAGHSGGSASVAIPVIHELLQFKNLCPLTNDPDEWTHVAEAMAGHPDLWQNRRNSEAFSHDGGKTYTLLSERERHGKILTYLLNKKQPVHTAQNAKPTSA